MDLWAEASTDTITLVFVSSESWTRAVVADELVVFTPLHALLEDALRGQASRT